MSKIKIGRYISKLTKYTHGYLGRELKTIDIGRGEFAHLMALYQKDLVTQDYLARNVHVDKGSTAKVIKSLLEQGYITKTVSPDDKRANLIQLTDKAWELEKKITPIFKNWNEILKKDISDGELDIFYKVSLKMIENANEYYKTNYKDYNITNMCKGDCHER